MTLADSVVPPEDIGPGRRPAKIELNAMTVEGRGFTLAALRDGAEAFGNRNYVWEQVPKQLQEWRYTQTFGGVTADMNVTAKRDTTLYMATAHHLAGIDTSGWEPVPELKFRYTDAARTPLQVFQRAMKAGARVAIPQGNWTGGLMLAPPEEQE